jgi:Tn3 transposase DDE domain-containing protein
VCIYSQLKTCSSSEVSAMVEGVLRHDTDMDVEKQYVDTHGQSEVGFAFCYLLGFALLPRLKNLKKQKLYRPQNGDPGKYPNLQAILTRPINWEIIEQQYDELIKFATALRLGTADAESIMRRFTKNNVQHPTYKALCELGKALKTVFLYDLSGVNYFFYLTTTISPDRVDSSLLLPDATLCLMKNVTRPYERDEWQIDEATEHGNKTRTDRGGGGALSSSHARREERDS